MLVENKNDDRTIVAGPLTGLVIKGRIDILNWILTIYQNNGSKIAMESIDSRILVMLQRQKELLEDAEEIRKPDHTSKLEVQGRIEMLEWLLMNE